MRPFGNRARQHSGEPARRASTPEPVLADLEGRTIAELQSEWRKLYRADPPTRLSRDLLVRAIAFRRQELVFGGSRPSIKRRLDLLARELEAKGAAEFSPAPALKPGTRLLREWHGQSHSVLVREDGFEYQGQRYPSLSRVATLITGVRWSGPVFFGLKTRPPATGKSHG